MFSGRSELKLCVQYRLNVSLEVISNGIGLVPTIHLFEGHMAGYRLSRIRKVLGPDNSIKILRGASRP